MSVKALNVNCSRESVAYMLVNGFAVKIEKIDRRTFL